MSSNGTKPHVGLILVMWIGPHLGYGLELSASAWLSRQQRCLNLARSSSLKRATCSAMQILNEAKGDVRGTAGIAGGSCIVDQVRFPWQPITRATRAIFAKQGVRQRSSSFGGRVVMVLPRCDGESNSRIETPEKAHEILVFLGQAPEGATPLEPAYLDQNGGQACAVSRWALWLKSKCRHT